MPGHPSATPRLLAAVWHAFAAACASPARGHRFFGNELYDLRNFTAHGDRLPDHFFKDTPRDGFNGPVNKLEVLTEAASFIIRTSLLKILHDGLLDHFADAGPAEAFFSAQDLTKSALIAKNKQKQTP